MKCPPLPHPADLCLEPCSTVPQGFAHNARTVLAHNIADISTVDQPGRVSTEGFATATSLISRQDAIDKAEAQAAAMAAERMRLYLTANPPPQGEWTI